MLSVQRNMVENIRGPLSRFSLKKNVLTALIAFVINMVLVFISYRLIILHSGLAAVGTWSTLMAWIYIARLGDIGVASALVKLVAERDIESDRDVICSYIETGLIFNTGLFLLITVVGYYLISRNLLTIVSVESVSMAQLILPSAFLGFFLSNVWAVVAGGFQGVHQGFMAARLGIFGSIVQLLVVVVLARKIGLLALPLGIVAQYSVMLLFGWPYLSFVLYRPALRYIKWSKSSFAEMFSFSWKIQCVNIINGFFEPLSKILVSGVASASVQGIFELAFKTVTLPRNAIMAGAQATLPATASMIRDGNSAKATQFYAQISGRVFRSGLILFTALVLFSPLIIYLWTGRMDTVYVVFVACLASGFAGNIFGATAYNLGIASGIVRANIISAVLTIAVLVLGALCLRPLLGPLGVGVAAGLALLTGGIYIKVLNERTILGLGR